MVATLNNSLTSIEDYLTQAVIKNGTEILYYCQSADAPINYTNRIIEEHLPYPLLSQTTDINWFIPDNYKSLNTQSYCLSLCTTEVQSNRVNEEFTYYNQYNMLPVLQSMKFIVDKLRENNVIWGVGRGSSVSSYVLFLLGVHKIDSIKYELDIKEFFH